MECKLNYFLLFCFCTGFWKYRNRAEPLVEKLSRATFGSSPATARAVRAVQTAGFDFGRVTQQNQVGYSVCQNLVGSFQGTFFGSFGKNDALAVRFGAQRFR